jgi:Phosphotransferase enzyme family
VSCEEAKAADIASLAEAQARLNWFRAELDSLPLPEGLPEGVCHCDSNAANFLYQDGTLSAVLDFDQSGYTSGLTHENSGQEEDLGAHNAGNYWSYGAKEAPDSKRAVT